MLFITLTILLILSVRRRKPKVVSSIPRGEVLLHSELVDHVEFLE